MLSSCRARCNAKLKENDAPSAGREPRTAQHTAEEPADAAGSAGVSPAFTHKEGVHIGDQDGGLN